MFTFLFFKPSIGAKKIDLEPDVVFQLKNVVKIYRGFSQTKHSLDINFRVFETFNWSFSRCQRSLLI